MIIIESGSSLKKVNVIVEQFFRDLRGENLKLLNNRAITVERVIAHSGTHFLNYLSVYE
ncbi:unnamed protein product, partial [Rotaria sp. Silwood1]